MRLTVKEGSMMDSGPMDMDKMLEVTQNIADRHRMDVGIIFGPRRYAEAARARRTVYYKLFMGGVGVAEIGRFLNKDHSSVIRGIQRYREDEERSERLASVRTGSKL